MLHMSRLLVILIAPFAALWLLDQVAPEYVHLSPVLQSARIITLSSLAFFSMSSVSEKLPSNNLASEQFSAWLRAFNTHDRDTLLAYHAKHFPYDVASKDVKNIDREMALSGMTGGFEIADVLDSRSDVKDDLPHALIVILHSKKNPHYAKASMAVDPEDGNHPVTKFDIHPTNTPLKFVPDDKKEEYERALAPLTQEKRRLVIKEIVEVLRKEYINPDNGEKIISVFEANEKKGEYDRFTDSEEFAIQLSDDAGALDKHIRIIFHEPPPARKDRDDGKEGDVDEKKKCPPELYDHLKEMNFGFNSRTIESIGTKKLGILDIRGFVPLGPKEAPNCTEIVETIGTFMSEIADTDALIIDLRANHGGAPDTVAFILSYFLGGDSEDDDGTVHLLDFVDRNGTVKRSMYTLPCFKLPQNSARFGSSKPLFVLTSEETVSGGEDMAYNLQAFKRARATISRDKTTAGAAHLPAGGPRFIAEEEFGEKWWVVIAPDQQPRHAATGTNWEGVGVVSDVVVGKEEDVLDVARKMARKELGLDQNSEGDYEL